MGWLKEQAGRIGSSIVAVVNVIFNLVDAFTDAIGDLSRFITQALTDLFNWVSNFGWRAYNGVLGLEKWAGDFARDIIHSIAATGEWAYNTATQWTLGQLHSLWDGLVHKIDSVHDFASGIIGWVNNNIWKPLSDQIGGVSEWFQRGYNNLADAVEDRLKQAKDFASRIVHDITDPIRSVVNAITDDWIPLLQRCKDFLVFVAHHPFDWWIVILRQFMERASSHMVGWIVSSFTQNAEKVEESLAKWLGE